MITYTRKSVQYENIMLLAQGNTGSRFDGDIILAWLHTKGASWRLLDSDLVLQFEKEEDALALLLACRN